MGLIRLALVELDLEFFGRVGKHEVDVSQMPGVGLIGRSSDNPKQSNCWRAARQFERVIRQNLNSHKEEDRGRLSTLSLVAS